MGAVTNRQRRSHAQGTTLVELMIVVVIIGILAAIATVGYKRYVARARLSEAHAMLAELSSKEQLYFMDAGAYVSVRATNDANDDATGYYPSPASRIRPSNRRARRIASIRIPLRGAGSACDPVGNSSIAPIWSTPVTQLACFLPPSGRARGPQRRTSLGSMRWRRATSTPQMTTVPRRVFPPTRPSWCSPTTRLAYVSSTTGSSIAS